MSRGHSCHCLCHSSRTGLVAVSPHGPAQRNPRVLDLSGWTSHSLLQRGTDSRARTSSLLDTQLHTRPPAPREPCGGPDSPCTSPALTPVFQGCRPLAGPHARPLLPHSSRVHSVSLLSVHGTSDPRSLQTLPWLKSQISHTLDLACSHVPSLRSRPHLPWAKPLA